MRKRCTSRECTSKQNILKMYILKTSSRLPQDVQLHDVHPMLNQKIGGMWCTMYVMENTRGQAAFDPGAHQWPWPGRSTATARRPACRLTLPLPPPPPRVHHQSQNPPHLSQAPQAAQGTTSPGFTSRNKNGRGGWGAWMHAWMDESLRSDELVTGPL